MFEMFNNFTIKIFYGTPEAHERLIRKTVKWLNYVELHIVKAQNIVYFPCVIYVWN